LFPGGRVPGDTEKSKVPPTETQKTNNRKNLFFFPIKTPSDQKEKPKKNWVKKRGEGNQKKKGEKKGGKGKKLNDGGVGDRHNSF